MLNLTDIDRYLHSLNLEVSEDQRLKMLLQADRDIGNRSVAGSIIIPIAYIVGGVYTDYLADFPEAYWFMAVLIFGSSLIRLLAIVRLKKVSAAVAPFWEKVLFSGVSITGMIWGIFSSTALVIYGNSWSSLFIILLSAGIGIGAFASFCIWRILLSSYLFFMLVPAILSSLVPWNPETAPVGFALLCFYIFLTVQGLRWNDEYWNSLINLFQLENHKKEMAEINRQLAVSVEDAKAANLAKSEFLANMSHELRTPMHAILSFSRFGMKRIDAVPRKKLCYYFQEIMGSGDRLLLLLNDLLDLSKLEADRMVYDFKERNFVVEIEMACTEFSVLAQDKNITLSIDKQNSVDVILFDRTRFGQLVRNLLSNAIKFSSRDSEITISICDDKIDSQVVGIKVCIADQGVGVPEDELEMVFNKFVQSSKTRSGAGGTGLGLAISRKIIQAHNGTIWVERNPGGGAIFCFTIPPYCRQNQTQGKVL